jgi:hypothetical protein
MFYAAFRLNALTLLPQLTAEERGRGKGVRVGNKKFYLQI